MRFLKVEEIDDKDFDASFASVTSVDDWMKYFYAMELGEKPEKLPERLRRNLAHLMQLIEFECGLLLLNLEGKRRYKGRSTLHETVSAMKIHQFTVLAHTVVEGLAGHLMRSQGYIAEGKNIATVKWRPEFAAEIARHDEGLSEGNIVNALQHLTNWRDRVHLDNPDGELHFNEFDYDNCFCPAYEAFWRHLTALNAALPKGFEVNPI